VKAAAAIDNKSSILLHLVGILSSRFAHDARSQEDKAYDSSLTSAVFRGEQTGQMPRAPTC